MFLPLALLALRKDGDLCAGPVVATQAVRALWPILIPAFSPRVSVARVLGGNVSYASNVSFVSRDSRQGPFDPRHSRQRSCRANSSLEDRSEGYGDGGRDLPPRFLRERSRGTRDDGDNHAADWDSRKASALTGRRAPSAGASERIGPILPRKLRGWPPRGGEGVLEEALFVREDYSGAGSLRREP